MRVVALEEHFTIPSLVARIPRDLIAQRGFPPPDAPWSPMRESEKIADLGASRLRAMDDGGVTVQVLSMAGPGADLLAADTGPAWSCIACPSRPPTGPRSRTATRTRLLKLT